MGLAVLSSCSDVLNEQPRSDYDPGFFESTTGVEGGLTALYSSLRDLYGNANSLLCHLVHEEVGFAAVPDRIPCRYVISVFLYCHIYSKAIMAHVPRSHFSSM